MAAGGGAPFALQTRRYRPPNSPPPTPPPLRLAQGEREKLPVHWPQKLKSLIDACWAQDPNHRPDFVTIYKRCAPLRERVGAGVGVGMWAWCARERSL